MSYRAPIKDMLFVMKELAGIDAVAELPGHEEAGYDTAAAVLEECAKLSEGVIAPLNEAGDKNPSSFRDGVVTTTPGFKDAFRQFAAGGWQGLQHPLDFGGQGLPKLIGAACVEMLNSANLSFSLCPLLTDGAIEALLTAGSDEQKQAYIPQMIAGAWTGTMNLTEPQAGSDLSLVHSRAEPQPDGSYKIFGTKIFITYGEHDMAENIVHLVLARVTGAPEGVKGISLFVCPKFLPDGTRNDVHCVSIEHKLGIKASPTAVLQYGDHGGAIGHLIGQENRGLEYMFIMMNAARFAVGQQGIAIAERAYQRAVAYARDRVQGRPVDGSLPDAGPIIHHPDVRRMLMTMRAYTEACRAMALVGAAAYDAAHAHPDAEVRRQNQAFYEFMVPLVKGLSTEMSLEVASLGVQVHGGMGFIEETGAAQHYRDARITPIYEGTNGIQSIDLVTRKLAANGGESVWALLDELKDVVSRVEVSNDPSFGTTGAKLRDALGSLERTSRWLLARVTSAPNEALAGATPYLRLFGATLGGCMLANEALAARGAGEADPQRHVTLARFFAENVSVQAGALERTVMDSADAVNGADAVLLG
ncbi:MAG: acyl-CoA dehydrogenase [Burkholderiales bacterium]|nr:acyl-CoA dehydrogenase [Burkholderiales bacterium]